MKEQLPFFSVIIPTYNRNAQLKSCLQALVAQAYPRDQFEVIVADDGSPEPPREIVASFSGVLTWNQVSATLLSQLLR